MGYVIKMDNHYSLRKRLNPHHSAEQVAQEQRNFRAHQYQRWSHVKSLYAAHRDEMVNTLDNDTYAEYKNILEKVFTMELDDALRDAIDITE